MILADTASMFPVYDFMKKQGICLPYYVNRETIKRPIFHGTRLSIFLSHTNTKNA